MLSAHPLFPFQTIYNLQQKTGHRILKFLSRDKYLIIRYVELNIIKEYTGVSIGLYIVIKRMTANPGRFM